MDTANIPDKPTPPEPWECCGGGSCCPCVWDKYYADLQQWQDAYQKDQTAQNDQKGQTDQAADSLLAP